MCKWCRALLRKLGRGGTDFPGKVALKICPDILGRVAKNVKVVIVTGTNGKTTTSRMVEQAMRDNGLSFFCNKSGANLLSGVTAEFAVNSSTWSGTCKYPYALIESDEAAFKAISKYVDAKVVVVTNLFRDQLDRYGEVSHTLENIKIGISHLPQATLCLNADDSLVASIAQDAPNQVLYFGVNTPIYKERVKEVSDAPYCVRCKHRYVYDYVTYGHLGGYRCPNCGYHRPTPQVAVTEVISSDAEQSVVNIAVDGKEYRAVINLPGGYNIYNACSCAAAGKAMGLDMPTVIESLSTFECGFGRMEKFPIGKTSVRMILVKNPAGCNQVLNFLSNASGPVLFTVCLNDRDADGTDVSWIWDVDFEKLCDMGDLLTAIYVSGVRADDMALRFKYAGIPLEKIHVEKDYGKLMDEVTDQEVPVYIMPTYTAMLDLRDKISKKYGFEEFWEK